MLTSKPEKDLSLMTILPMIQSIVLNCWDRDNFPYTKSQVILFSVLLSRESATMKEIAAFLSCSKEQAKGLSGSGWLFPQENPARKDHPQGDGTHADGHCPGRHIFLS